MGVLRNLSYLQEVAKTKSINKAADNLYISKSALSAALKNLEEEFGVPLLNRSVHGVSLTEAGEMAVDRASLIFNILDTMRDECMKYNEDKLPLVFYTEDQFASSILPHILTELKSFRMNYYITTKSANYSEILNAVKADKNNVGLFLSNTGSQVLTANNSFVNELQFISIASFRVGVVAAKYSKYISLNVKELHCEDIKGIPQIELLLKENNTDLWGDSRLPFESNYVMSTDSNTIYFQAILNDIGIGALLNIQVPFGLADRNQLRFIPLVDSEQIDLWMICNKESDMETMQSLSEVIRNAVS